MDRKFLLEGVVKVVLVLVWTSFICLSKLQCKIHYILIHLTLGIFGPLSRLALLVRHLFRGIPALQLLDREFEVGLGKSSGRALAA